MTKPGKRRMGISLGQGLCELLFLNANVAILWWPVAIGNGPANAVCAGPGNAIEKWPIDKKMTPPGVMPELQNRVRQLY